jgi:hypothetical protein
MKVIKWFVISVDVSLALLARWIMQGYEPGKQKINST